jgi:phytoene dehydrogenase-like protein
MEKKKVIVIGAGIGGLSAAVQLAYCGFNVTVLEKNAAPGGKIIQLKKKRLYL